jgi:hypothetical protein
MTLFRQPHRNSELKPKDGLYLAVVLSLRIVTFQKDVGRGCWLFGAAASFGFAWQLEDLG